MSGIQRRLPLYLFLIVFGIYAASPVIQSFDSRWTMYVSMSLIRQRNIDLDEYADLLSDYYAVDHYNGHIYSLYPIGTALMALPPVLILDLVTGGAFGNGLAQKPDYRAEMLIASIIVALSVVVLYYIARIYLSAWLALFAALIFAFGTSAWSTSSRALWQHGPTMLMLGIALYAMLKGKEKPYLIPISGAVLAYCAAIRPTNVLPIIALTVYVFIEYRQQFIGYVLAALVVAIPIELNNIVTWNTLIPPYYFEFHEHLWTLSTFFVAFFGHIFSPSRGLLIFSPIMVLAFAGIALKVRNKQLTKLDVALIVVLIVYWLLISSYQYWVGGTSYGPRYVADMIPYLMYFMLPALTWLVARRNKFMWGVVIVLLAISILINYRGASRQETLLWVGDPWDWSHPQFLQ